VGARSQAPSHTFVAFGIRASISSALTASRCGAPAPGWSSPYHHDSLIVELFPDLGLDTPVFGDAKSTVSVGWGLVVGGHGDAGWHYGRATWLMVGLSVRPAHRLRAMDRETLPGLAYGYAAGSVSLGLSPWVTSWLSSVALVHVSCGFVAAADQLTLGVFLGGVPQFGLLGDATSL